MNNTILLKFLNMPLFVLLLAGCQTTVADYNSPQIYTNDSDAVEMWMNDDGVNSAVVLKLNGQEAWQRKPMQGAAMSVVLPSGSNDISIRMIYQEFMEFPLEQVVNIKVELAPQFKYIFVSNYDEHEKSFTYRLEKIAREAECKYGPTNFKRIVTGKLSCRHSGSVYSFN
ncbi:hypothetical protein [Aliiglaciecola litoralis]|uniref:Lipoprotein n=1 Tax=Aliiglaciecola litoralis TaxID=582857 RepID=A0ABN1LFG8_9ALTE